MSKNKKKPKYPRDSKLFYAFLCKVHERLKIMLDYNVSTGVDPSEEDIKLLDYLYEMYDKAELAWLREDLDVEQVVRQSSLFTDKEAEKA